MNHEREWCSDSSGVARVAATRNNSISKVAVITTLFGETLDVLLAVSVAPQVSAGDRARGGVRLGSGRDFGVLVVAGNEIAEERGPP
jgi:hypothetical protein